MNFELSEEQAAIFEMARAVADEHIAPNARAWEAEGTIPRALWPKLAELGFGALYVSEDAGGAGLSRLDATLVFEALSQACPSVAAFLSIHNMCAKMISAFGSYELRGRFRSADVDYRVCKNTLLQIALDRIGGLDELDCRRADSAAPAVFAISTGPGVVSPPAPGSAAPSSCTVPTVPSDAVRHRAASR